MSTRSRRAVMGASSHTILAFVAGPVAQRADRVRARRAPA